MLRFRLKDKHAPWLLLLSWAVKRFALWLGHLWRATIRPSPTPYGTQAATLESPSGTRANAQMQETTPASSNSLTIFKTKRLRLVSGLPL